MFLVNSVLKQKLSPPDESFSFVSEMISIHTTAPGKRISPVGIYVHWKPKAECILWSFAYLLKILRKAGKCDCSSQNRN